MRRPKKAEYIAYVKRWRLVNEYERSELRRTSKSRKLRQLSILMASAPIFPRAETSSAEDEKTWERWNLLRKAHRV